MDNKDKIISEVAVKLGLTRKQVLEVVTSQTSLLRKAIQGKEATTVYLRQVGSFMSRPVRQRMVELLKAHRINKYKDKVTVEEEPLRF